jgi:SAM-dependent methyltransferase
VTTRESPALNDVQIRELRHHDELAATLEPAAMPPRPPDEWERALLDAAGDVTGRDVLEIGCGEGGLSIALLDRGARLTATDLSPGMVDVARERAERFRPGAGARFVAAPVEALGLGIGQYDLVIGKFILHHLDLQPAVAELSRVLRPGGRGLFMETSGVNPLLAWARRRLVGRFGVFRYGTDDELPLTRRDLEAMTAAFSRVRARFPVFWLFQMLERQWLRHHFPAAAPLTRRADRFLAARVPRLTPYGYFMLVELERPNPR